MKRTPATDEPPNRDRLRALAAPLLIAIGFVEDLRNPSIDSAESPREKITNQGTSRTRDSDLQVRGILSPRSQNRDVRSRIVELGSTLGVSETRSADEIARDFDLVFWRRDSSQADGLTALAQILGLGDSRESPYLLKLESIGQKLGVRKEYYFDQNIYYSNAVNYWTEAIAEKLGISSSRSNEDILRAVGGRVGASFQPSDRGEVAVLQRIAAALGVGWAGDEVKTLRRVESAIRTRGLTRGR